MDPEQTSITAPVEPQNPAFAPLPSMSDARFGLHMVLPPLVCDERMIARMLEKVLEAGGLSHRSAAKELGMTGNALRQYLVGRRRRPSLIWFVRLCALAGVKVLVEFPPAK